MFREDLILFLTKFQNLKKKELSLLSTFVISLVITMLLCVVYKSERMVQTEVLSPDALSLIKVQSFNKGALFLYIIQRRIWIIPFIFLFSTTYLAGPMVYGIIVWYGNALGGVLSLVILRYGIKGILFLILCSLPQYIFYLPAWVIALRLSVTERVADRRFFLQLFVLEMVIFIGCFCEKYMNPLILPKIIKIFIGV